MSLATFGGVGKGPGINVQCSSQGLGSLTSNKHFHLGMFFDTGHKKVVFSLEFTNRALLPPRRSNHAMVMR